MTKEKTYLIVQAVVCTLLTALLAAVAIGIYRQGAAAQAAGDVLAPIFTREKAVAGVLPVLALVLVSFGMSIGGMMMGIRDERALKPVKSIENSRNLIRAKTGKPSKAMKKWHILQIVLFVLGGLGFAACMCPILLYVTRPYNFTLDITFEQMFFGLMKCFIPWTVLGIAWLAISGILQDKVMLREIEETKKQLSAERGGAYADDKKAGAAGKIFTAAGNGAPAAETVPMESTPGGGTADAGDTASGSGTPAEVESASDYVAADAGDTASGSGTPAGMESIPGGVATGDGLSFPDGEAAEEWPANPGKSGYGEADNTSVNTVPEAAPAMTADNRSSGGTGNCAYAMDGAEEDRGTGTEGKKEGADRGRGRRSGEKKDRAKAVRVKASVEESLKGEGFRPEVPGRPLDRISLKVPVQDAGESKALRIARIVVLAAAAVMIIVGVVQGGARDVLIKAINICTECIGLG